MYARSAGLHDVRWSTINLQIVDLHDCWEQLLGQRIDFAIVNAPSGIWYTKSCRVLSINFACTGTFAPGWNNVDRGSRDNSRDFRGSPLFLPQLRLLHSWDTHAHNSAFDDEKSDENFEFPTVLCAHSVNYFSAQFHHSSRSHHATRHFPRLLGMHNRRQILQDISCVRYVQACTVCIFLKSIKIK